MKKIIYSLVIMIAAGSLFTSCIEQVEPLGIQDMRFAKAEYIRALKDLRAADAELVRAEAAHEQARARYVDAMTANLNADTEYQQLLNEYQQLINEARQDTNDVISAETASKIDSIKKLMAERELTHQKNMVAAQDSLANAQERLRVALRNIALYSQSLNPAEKKALENATKAYEIAFEKVANQTVKVFKAQQRLDSAKIMLARTDKAVAADSSFVDYREYYQTQLEAAQAKAVLSGLALAAIGYNFDNPTDTSSIVIPEDLAEWKDEIAAFEDSVDALKYSKADIRNDIANYYVANIHDGYTTFNNKVAEFKDEWWDKSVTPAKEPTAPEGPGAEPKASDYKAADYLNDSLTFPVLAKKDFDEAVIFDKYTFLLRSYDEDSPLSTVGTNMIYTKNDTVMFGPLGDKTYSGMKDFVLGAAGKGEGSQVLKDKNGKVKATANYGLWGAYDILERELVTTLSKAPTEEEIADAKKLMDKADSTWNADRKILIDGVAKYVPFNEARAALATEEEENGKGSENMVQAIKDINAAYAKVAGITTPATWDGFDSSEFFTAIIAFAKAREEYLGEGYHAPDADFDYADPTTWNRNMFYYSAGSTTSGKVILAQKKFSELTYPEFQKGIYDCLPVDPGTTSAPADGDYVGLANIINQLLGNPFLAAINPGAHDAVMTQPNPTAAEAKWALYDIYGVSTTWKTPETIMEGTEPFTPAALVKAKDTVEIRINEYVNAYNKFWNVSVTTADPIGAHYASVDAAIAAYFAAMDAQDADAIAEEEGYLIEAIEKLCDKSKLNPTCYTLNTFTNPYNVVAFTGAAIDQTDAILAILTAVDPAAASARSNNDFFNDDKGGDFSKSAIFKGNATDFYWFMYYTYEYNKLVNKTAKNDLNTIKTWIEGVAGAYDADVAAAPGKATAAYNTAHSTWQTKKNTYDTKKAEWDEYAAAKAAFVGTRPVKTGETEDWVDADGNKVKFYAFVEFNANQYDKFSKFFDGNNDEVTFKYVDKDPIYDVYTGKWVKEIAGKQLEIANTLFPKLPENMKTWQNSLDAINDKISHFETLAKAYNSAYTDAAKAKYDVDGSKLKDVIYNVQKDILDDFAEVIEAYEKAVGTKTVEGEIQKYTKKIRDYEKDVILGQVQPAEFALAAAEADLAVETARLQGYQDVLAYAKANLEKILEYIKSLDVNFVVVTDKDIENQQK